MNRILAILLTALLVGCATSRHQFASPSPSWKSATGQLRYQGSGVTIIGELQVSRGEAGTRIEFSKGAGLSLMSIIADKTHLRFEGPLARGTREVTRGAALPSHLVVWGQLVDSAGSAGPQTLSHDGTALTFHLPPLR